MTRDEIEKMPAGFLMRALIAEKLFGFSNIKSGYRFIAGYTESGHLEPIPNYPEDIAAAWQVVEKLKYVDLGVHGDDYVIAFVFSPDGEIITSGTAETAPLAICRAALMAVML